MQKSVFFQKSGLKFLVFRKIFVPLHPLRKKQHRGVEQLVARQAHNLEVARSNPASATQREMQAKRLAFFSANNRLALVQKKYPVVRFYP